MLQSGQHESGSRTGPDEQDGEQCERHMDLHMETENRIDPNRRVVIFQ